MKTNQVVHVSLANQRHFYCSTLSNFFFLFFFALFSNKVWGSNFEILCNTYGVTHMGGVTPLFTKCYIWVVGVDKTQFLALRNYGMASMRCDGDVWVMPTKINNLNTSFKKMAKQF